MSKDHDKCIHCGSDIIYITCWKCGGEGGRGWDDLQFEDPLWYSPGDFIDCDECYGAGSFPACSNSECKAYIEDE